MKKRIVTFFSTLIAIVMLLSAGLLAACGTGKGGGNGEGSGGSGSGSHTEHVDQNGDGRCDKCGAEVPLPGTGGDEDNPGTGGDEGGDEDNPGTGGDEDNPGDKQDDAIRVVFHITGRSNYSDCDIWLWYGTAAGKGYLLTYKDSYGVYTFVDVPAGTESVGFIVRTGCSDPGGTTWGEKATKDATGDDRSVPLSDRFIKDGQLDLYLKMGDARNYISNNGGKTIEEMKLIQLADLTGDLNKLRYNISPAAAVTKEMVTVTDTSNDRVIPVSSVDARTSSITLTENLDVAGTYKLEIDGYGDAPVVPNTYFSSVNFNKNYQYDGKLGVELTVTNKAIFRLWAPTCKSVALNIYDSGTEGQGTAKSYPLTGGSQAEKGVWTKELDRSEVENKYYTYTVVNSLGESEVVDPYAVSAGVEGRRGMILDISKTNPEGYTDNEKRFVPQNAVDGKINYTDADIWEIHVRDFSNMNTAQKEEYRGKYMAFTETNLTNSDGIPVGVNYLKQLGITHVHLLPSFDIASVVESAGTGFNWGYDPLNYNVPEGSYSTDPTHGEVRVKEFKAMVQALHKEGIGVIMDVVYNHTSGLDSNFQKIVPYYYYRFQGNGKPYNGSGCGNETASDRAMFRKFMIDSVTHWMTDYNVDGFRFDLMGLHDTTTMQQIEKAVHEINPNALLYGEGWTGGTSGLLDGLQSTLKHIGSVNTHANSVAMFNDVTRDALKGDTNDASTGYATGAKSADAAKVMFGVLGGATNSSFGVSSGNSTSYWGAAPNPTAVVNYASAHDNYALYDKLLLAYPGNTNARLERNRLVAAIVQTSLGIPFMQAGEEMLRSKPNGDGTYNENSYNAPDSVNNLKWANLTKNSNEYKMMQYYSGLIAFRRAHAVLRSPVSSVVKLGSAAAIQGTLIQFQMTQGSETIYVVYNAGTQGTDITLPSGDWGLYINKTQAGTTQIGSNVSGKQHVDPVSCYVWVKK